MVCETLKYSVSMTANNTFHEDEKSLEQEIGVKRKGKRGSSTKVMLVHAITVEIPNNAVFAAADELEVQLTTNSESDIVNISDKDLFWKMSLYTIGAEVAIIDRVRRYVVERPYIKKDMYIGVNAESIAANLTYGIEIDFEYTYVSDWALSRMISRKA